MQVVAASRRASTRPLRSKSGPAILGPPSTALLHAALRGAPSLKAAKSGSLRERAVKSVRKTTPAAEVVGKLEESRDLFPDAFASVVPRGAFEAPVRDPLRSAVRILLERALQQSKTTLAVAAADGKSVVIIVPEFSWVQTTRDEWQTFVRNDQPNVDGSLDHYWSDRNRRMAWTANVDSKQQPRKKLSAGKELSTKASTLAAAYASALALMRENRQALGSSTEELLNRRALSGQVVAGLVREHRTMRDEAAIHSRRGDPL